MPDGFARHQHHAADIHRKYSVEIRNVKLGQWPFAIGTRAIDQNVKAAEPSDCGSNGGDHRSLVAKIGLDKFQARLSADIDVEADDMVTGANEF
jgi:hypothetical protein